MSTVKKDNELFFSQLTNINSSLKNLPNLILMCAIKVIGRIKFSNKLNKILTKCRIKEEIKICVSITKGYLLNFILNTSYKIDECINGYSIDKACYINVNLIIFIFIGFIL